MGRNDGSVLFQKETFLAVLLGCALSRHQTRRTIWGFIMWYLKRLSTMQSTEVLWRAKTAARIPFDWLEYKQHRRANTYRATDLYFHSAPEYPIRAHRAGLPIDSVKIFDLRFDPLTDFNWHKDYLNDLIVPRKFCRAINVRNTAQVGDIKYIWELNRHQYLSALAYCFDDGTSGDYIVSTIDGWIEKNPPLDGVNWTSSLELALRLISWSFIYPTILDRPSFSIERRLRFYSSVFDHLREISQNLSRYSSANNHLIGEAAGLYVGATCFPQWKNSSRWRTKAKAILEREILDQISSDGVNKEQAMSYHLFTLELFLLAMIIGEKSGDPFSDAFKDRVRSMLVYLNSIATDGGDLPSLGDSDDARGFLVSPHENNLLVTMELGALLFREREFLRFSGNAPTCASQALLSSEALKSFGYKQKAQAGQNVQCLFKDGGKAVLDNGNRDLTLLMEFGELGYRSIAAHGHADALSIQLAVGGTYLLVDSGTFAYHSHEKWRTYFRGTSAHNTIRIDYQDQSVMGGRFLWTAHAKSRLLNYQERPGHYTVEAEHNGYTRLADPVIHRRRSEFDTENSEISIIDTLQCDGAHIVELFLHFHQQAVVEVNGRASAQTSFNGRQISISFECGDLEMQLVKGSEVPILGWRSTSFNSKQPINTLRVFGPIHGTTTLTTIIKVQDESRQRAVS